MARERARRRPRSSRPRRRARRKAPWWSRLPRDELLDVRLSDLGLRVEDSVVESRVAQLHRELERAGLRFAPYVWLSTDWFTPSGVTGFAVPFYLAHPRLSRIESQHMLEVEGGSHDACMRLLRHETAHALDHAYRLGRRKSWQDVFGRPGEIYRPSYVPRPNSRRYVLNLNNWYAQSHPVEDFAETFAVWLQPRSAWRRRYRGWPALRKLEYVDALMDELRDKKPRLRTRERPWSLPQLRITLREYYERKQAHYGKEDRSGYDRDLKRFFSDDPVHRRRPLASTFLRQRRAALRRQVSTLTGQHAFVVDEVLKHMIARCRDLRLRLAHSEREAGLGAAVLLTMHAVRLSRMRHREYWR
jgi:hypothetical protein